MKSPIYEAAGYDTDLSYAWWELIEPLFYPAGARRGRGRRREAHAARASLDAIRFILKADRRGSLLPRDFPPKSTEHDALAGLAAAGSLAAHQHRAARAGAHRDADLITEAKESSYRA